MGRGLLVVKFYYPWNSLVKIGLLDSAAIAGMKIKGRMYCHCSQPNAVVLKIGCRNGRYTTTSSNAKEESTA